MVCQEAVYHHRIDSADANIGIFVPLLPHVIGESFCSYQMEEVIIGLGSDALWLPDDVSVSPLSVEIDGLWCQDATDLAYPRVARDLYHLPAGYRMVVPPEGAIVTECPPGHVAVYTHHFEFGLCLPLDYFFGEDFECIQRVLGSTDSLCGLEFDCVHLHCTLFGISAKINLLCHIHWLKKNVSFRQKGWWLLITTDKKMTVQPKMTGSKGWQDAFSGCEFPRIIMCVAISLSLILTWSTYLQFR